MKKALLLFGLATAIACGSSAGDMMNEAFDDMTDVPDVGAQPPGNLRVACDIVEDNYEFAEVAGSELPGVFNSYICTEAEGGIPVFFGQAEEPTCIIVAPVIMQDGRYRFDCTRGNGGYAGSTIGIPEPRHVQIVR